MTREVLQIGNQDGQRAEVPTRPAAEASRLVALAIVRKLTGLSRSTIWRLERKGLFPQRLRISQKRIAWVEGEILNWNQSRVDDGRGVVDRR